MLENDENGESLDCKQKSVKENVEADSEIHGMPMLDLKCDSENQISDISNGDGEVKESADKADEEDPPLTNGCGEPKNGKIENHENENEIFDGKVSEINENTKSDDEQMPKNENNIDKIGLNPENNETQPASSTSEENKAEFHPDEQSENNDEEESEMIQTPGGSGIRESTPTPPPEISSTTQGTDAGKF